MGEIDVHIADEEIAYYDTALGKNADGYIFLIKKDRLQMGKPIVLDENKPIILQTIATPKLTVTTKTSAAGYTITAAELLGGFISDTTSTGAIAATLPTVASVVALLPGWVPGTSFRFVYKNPGNQTVTLTTGATWTMVGTMTIAATKYREFLFVIATGVTGSCYALITGDY